MWLRAVNKGAAGGTATRQTKKLNTAIHEVGHSVIAGVTNNEYHETLLVGYASASAEGWTHAQSFAPTIVRKLRNNIAKSYNVPHSNRHNDNTVATD